jgi:hypothetical protein
VRRDPAKQKTLRTASWSCSDQPTLWSCAKSMTLSPSTRKPPSRLAR